MGTKLGVTMLLLQIGSIAIGFKVVQVFDSLAQETIRCSNSGAHSGGEGAVAPLLSGSDPP